MTGGFTGVPLSEDLYAKLTDGSGPAERLFTDSDRALIPGVLPLSWSPDGNVLAYATFSEGSFSSWLLPLEGERSPQPFAVTAYNELMLTFSPDGRWVAYVADESDRDEIYIRPYPGPGGKVPVSKDGGTEPTWSADGTELFFRSGDQVLAVTVQAGRTFLDVGAPRVLFEGQYLTQLNARSYDVHPDGKRFLMIDPGREATDLVIVLNWFEELERLVPTDN